MVKIKAMLPHLLSLVLVAMLALSVSCIVPAPTASPKPTPAHTDITVEDAKQMIDTDRNVILLDVRTQSEYNSAHISGAVLIPVSKLEERIGELRKGRKIIVYCRSGHRSLKASKILTEHGFPNVYNMLGGIKAWTGAEYPVEKPTPTPSPESPCGCF